MTLLRFIHEKDGFDVEAFSKVGYGGVGVISLTSSDLISIEDSTSFDDNFELLS